jgi:hypothetical protein
MKKHRVKIIFWELTIPLNPSVQYMNFVPSIEKVILISDFSGLLGNFGDCFFGPPAALSGVGPACALSDSIRCTIDLVKRFDGSFHTPPGFLHSPFVPCA